MIEKIKTLLGGVVIMIMCLLATGVLIISFAPEEAETDSSNQHEFVIEFAEIEEVDGQNIVYFDKIYFTIESEGRCEFRPYIKYNIYFFCDEPITKTTKIDKYGTHIEENDVYHISIHQDRIISVEKLYSPDTK